ncbi:MAG TPA: PDZ domain-containing protein [Ferruginibacter sp.]|nr:PDZ domain-containing protein [Ferruginibacter sp.]
MKRIIALGIITWFFAFCSQKAIAQNDNPPPPPPPTVVPVAPPPPPPPPPPGQKSETQEIIIRKKGDKDKTIILSFDNKKVMVNGKPLVEFNDNEISINNRRIVIGKKLEKNIDDIMRDFDIQLNGTFEMDDDRVKEVIDYGRSTAFLGVAFENENEGAKISSVEKNSPAEKAGLQKDDIITKVGEEKINTGNNLAVAVNKLNPKDEVKISYLRNGRQKSAKVTLGEKIPTFTKSFSFSDGPRNRVITVPGYKGPKKWGTEDFNKEKFFDEHGNWEDFDFFNRQKLGLKIQDTEEANAVKVIDVEENSLAASAGLKKDDIIIEINGAEVTNTDEARDLLRSTEQKPSYSIKALRNGNAMNFTIKIPKKLKTAEL